MAIKNFTVEFNKDTYTPEIVNSYATGTGIFKIKISNVLLLTYPSGSMFMRIQSTTSECLDVDGEVTKIKDNVLDTANLYIGKDVDGEFEEGFGMNLFRSLLGVGNKAKATAKPYTKELPNIGKDVDVQYFPALVKLSVNVFIQEEFSLYDDAEGNEKLSTKMVIKRFYNKEYKTATELMEKLEAEAYLKDLDRYKPNYLDDLDKEIVNSYKNNKTSKDKTNKQGDDDSLADNDDNDNLDDDDESTLQNTDKKVKEKSISTDKKDDIDDDDDELDDIDDDDIDDLLD